MIKKHSFYFVKVFIQIIVFGFAFIACEGPEGPMGPQGDQGIQGEQGLQGPQGESFQLPDIESDFEPITSSWLPAVHVNTNGVPVDQRVTWIPSSYVLYDEYGNILHTGDTGIRGRGNSTWFMPKQPYNLNLNTSTSILGMPSHRRWALLANFADKTLLRTDVAFNFLASVFDNFAWTPRSQHVDLFLNGSYRGVYQLTENIRVDVNRVNINPISSGNPNGGFLLEICERMGDEFNFRSTRGLAFNCSSPDSNLNVLINVNGTQMTIFERIRSFVQEAEDVLFSAGFADPITGWQKYLDMESFVDWYLINEIAKEVDSQGFSSIYMYYDPVEQKIFMGPLWDFDISMGNVNYAGADNPRGFYIKNGIWWNRLFQDPAFVNAVKVRWNSRYSQLLGINNFIDTRAAALHAAQAQNFSKWLILDRHVWPNAVVNSGGYVGEINYLKSWLTTRITWLNIAINNL